MLHIYHGQNIFTFNTWKLMLRVHQFGSLKAWITTIQIHSIYGKNQPKTNLNKTCSSKQRAVRCIFGWNLQNGSIKSTWITYRHKRLVGILENINVEYKSVCMPGKVNNRFNSMLNDIMNNLFQYTHHFFPWLYKIPSFPIFIPQPRSPFHERLQ